MKGIAQIAATLPQFILFVFLYVPDVLIDSLFFFFNPKEVSKL